MCKNAVDIPTFQNKTGFDNWRVDTIDKCAAIDNRSTCLSQDDCSYDDLFSKCYYDKRKCLIHEDENSNVECHTRCELMNIPNKLEKSKMNCDSAKLLLVETEEFSVASGTIGFIFVVLIFLSNSEALIEPDVSLKLSLRELKEIEPEEK